VTPSGGSLCLPSQRVVESIAGILGGGKREKHKGGTVYKLPGSGKRRRQVYERWSKQQGG